MNGINWNQEETILAFDLYCRTPFGRIGQSNPDIIKLAELLGRTPGAVSLKMSNLAHYDPELQKRHITAMAHGSKLDAEIFEKFSNNWTELIYQAQLIKAKLKKQRIEELFDIRDIEKIPLGEYRDQIIKTRVGQYFFRMSVLNSYGNKCCITGLSNAKLLIASHIKPWADSNERTERTNPSNGLCLNALHDMAFDKGLITLDKDYHIIISSLIKDSAMDLKTRDWFMSYENAKIHLPDKFLPGEKFIEYHNDIIFQG
ncbi:HNH endonuclease [Pectinatus haikarae]|uniref:Restriction endonuclease n=1 Tax=Pectinatus haikarae TaxID=349096 RepID=A0ABT9Y8G4_9FIRM|nr:HNH endonuclease [Pectinatus haikarae]MDQ0204125.1 putative restriction endonuclease [Pectinatus haikarae]